jgi:hypothetical protein
LTTQNDISGWPLGRYIRKSQQSGSCFRLHFFLLIQYRGTHKQRTGPAWGSGRRPRSPTLSASQDCQNPGLNRVPNQPQLGRCGMANSRMVPHRAAGLTSTISQIPPLLAQIIAGVVHLLLLVAKLALSLLSVPILTPLLIVSVLGTLSEKIDSFVAETTNKQGTRDALSSTATIQEERVEVQDRRESKTGEPSVGYHTRDLPRRSPISASR